MGYDSTYGVGEFIYLKGVASTAVGNVVNYDLKGNTTVRGTDAAATTFGPAAIAMSANVASQYGWYQIFGTGVVTAGTVAAGKMCTILATAGTVDDTTTAGDYIFGLFTQSADGTPAAGQCVCMINYPFIPGVNFP
jgi:hypothetical protein